MVDQNLFTKRVDLTAFFMNLETLKKDSFSARKSKETVKLIQKSLTQHKDELTSPLEILRRLGSFELAALTGSYLCCAHMGMPVLIDGFASAVAALITAQICPEAEQWFLYSHTSNNPAHKLILKTLKAQPFLQLEKNIDNMAGITTALSLLHLSCANHNKMIKHQKIVSEK